MCRWMAYFGDPVPVEDLLFRPEHSIIDQSLHAKLGGFTTNGDGFGIGWYGTGSALESWVGDSAERLAQLQDLHQRWPFFRSVLSNLEMVLAKTDMAIASRYAELCPDASCKGRATLEQALALRDCKHVPAGACVLGADRGGDGGQVPDEAEAH